MQTQNQITGLQHITYTACPECGNREIIKMEMTRRHCNGHYNEYLVFGCGAHYHFSPNFMRVTAKQHCSTVTRKVVLTATTHLVLELGPDDVLEEVMKTLEAPRGYFWKDHNSTANIVQTELVRLREKGSK